MTKLTEDQINNIAGRIKVLESDKEDIETAIANLKTTLEGALGDGEHYEGDFKIEVFTGKMLNAAYAKKNQPDLFAKGSKMVSTFNAKTANELLEPYEYALVQKPNDKKTVKVSLRED
jgi:hypothetical protein